ncbi:MAG: hypothetical protein ABEI06_04465 [Halobacteriaceae archaeon]
MREIISESSPTPSSKILIGIFVVLNLLLLWVAVAFIIEVFGAADPTILGMNLAAGFALIGLLVIIYYRLFVPHKIVYERDEDLW